MPLQFNAAFDRPGNNSFFSSVGSLEARFGQDGDDTFFSSAESKTFKDGAYWLLPSVLSGGPGNDRYNVGYNDYSIIADAGSGDDYLRVYRDLSDVQRSARIDGRHLIAEFQLYSGSTYTTWLFIVDAFKPDGSIERTEFSDSVILDTSWSNLPSLIASAGIPFEDLTWQQAIEKKYINLSIFGVTNNSTGSLQAISEFYGDAKLPPGATLSLNPSTSASNEGATVTTTVATSNVAPGTMLFWSVSGKGINSSDFSFGALTGSGTIGTGGGGDSASLMLQATIYQQRVMRLFS